MGLHEALRLLRGGTEGIAEWNRRRHADSYIGHNLAGMDLTGADLLGVNLFREVLYGVNFSEANLSGANLGRTDLFQANFFGAILTGADLSGALFDTSNLAKAILVGANLSAAKFTGANLAGADLRGARCIRTIFANVDLSEVKGLDSVNPLGPCTLGSDTLTLSKGKIPESFLRDCGVPEAMITYLPSIIHGIQPIQFYSCFISYSTKDEEFAKRLHARMDQEKIRVWFSPEDAKGGEKLHEQIDEAIWLHDKLLLILSPHSMASEWVMTEIRKARKAERQEKKRKLFPLRLVDFDAIREWQCFDADGGKDLAVEVREYHIPDFSTWKDHDAFEAGFAHLMRDLKKADEPPS